MVGKLKLRNFSIQASEIREKAVRALDLVAGETTVHAALETMLNDPMRNVREAAAWSLRSTVDVKQSGGTDLQQMLDLEADQPTGRFDEAILLLVQGKSNPKTAEQFVSVIGREPFKACLDRMLGQRQVIAFQKIINGLLKASKTNA
jgi:hypothetical protein